MRAGELARKILLTTIILLSLFIPLGSPFVNAEKPSVLVVSIDDVITVATAELVKEALAEASLTRAEALVLLLNTPGGNLDVTFDITEMIEASEIPVIGYVYPEGARAWSAGTYILLSCHIAAMAPHTIIGSCQPVVFSPLEGARPVNETKIVNALAADLAEKARKHGRNEEVAIAFVVENLNLNAEEAKDRGVIEFVASSVDELLSLVDGMVVTTPAGEVTLSTQDAEKVTWSPSPGVSVLKVLANPMIAYLLFILGLYALIFGFATPGYGGEIIGGVCVILGLIGLGFTEVSIGALLLIGLGAVLLIAEIVTAGFGLAGGAGIFCIACGSFFLLPQRWTVAGEWLQSLFMLAIAVSITAGAFVIFAAYKVAKVRLRRPVVGELIGNVAEAVDNIEPRKTGFVGMEGELWRATSDEPIQAGQKVEVVGRDGTVLKVRLRKD